MTNIENRAQIIKNTIEDKKDTIEDRNVMANRREGNAMQPQQLAPGLWWVALTAPTLPPFKTTNSLIIADDVGADCVGSDAVGQAWVVDVGGEADGKALALWLNTQGLTLARVLITHCHIDHIAGVNALLAHVKSTPELSLWVHPLEQFRLDEQVGDSWPRQPWTDGTLFHFGNHTLECFHTPGHSMGHMAILITPDTTNTANKLVAKDTGENNKMRFLFAADMVADETSIWVGTPEGNVQDYLDSLATLKALEPTHLLPSHGGVSEGKKVEEILDFAYNHKLEREAQVVAVLDEQPAGVPVDVDVLVDALYGAITGKMREFIRRSILAYLERLIGQKRVIQQGDGYCLVADVADG